VNPLHTCEAAGDHPGPAGPVGEPGQRNRERRIDRREGDAAQQPELALGQMQLGHDARREDAEDLPVDEIEGVDE
jgi:hypothetical protein